MYHIVNTINTVPFQDVQAQKLLDLNAKECLFISLEAGGVLKKHSSPTDAWLLVLEGKITFHINNNEYVLEKHQLFDFPKDEIHWVTAQNNAKFIVIR
jgi:quercetin dioxygenase-like cupin family protein